MRDVRLGALLSVALHALIALGVGYLAWRAPTPPAGTAARPIAWLAAPGSSTALTKRELGQFPSARPPAPEQPSPEPALQRPRPLVRGRAPPTDATRPDRAATPTDASAPAEGRDADAADIRAPLDVADARERAIEAVLNERAAESSYRSFLFPGTIAEQRAFDEAGRERRVEAGLQAPLTAFDSPSKGRAGLTEETPLGVQVRWVSDDCYQTTGTGNPFVLQILQDLYDSPTVTCARPRARGDLFENAGPAYLMSADERATAVERAQRMERLRRPTTGVVMSLEE